MTSVSKVYEEYLLTGSKTVKQAQKHAHTLPPGNHMCVDTTKDVMLPGWPPTQPISQNNRLQRLYGNNEVQAFMFLRSIVSTGSQTTVSPESKKIKLSL
jgi:hypothetical protein